MFKLTTGIALFSVLAATSVAQVPLDFSETPSVTEEFIQSLLLESLTESESRYRDAFLKTDLSSMNALVDAFYDPDAEGTLSSRDAILERIAHCSTLSYRAFSPEFSSKALGIVDDGGSYADAMLAFNDAIGNAVASGSVSEIDMLSMIQGAGLIVKRCTDTVGLFIVDEQQ